MNGFERVGDAEVFETYWGTVILSKGGSATFHVYDSRVNVVHLHEQAALELAHKIIAYHEKNK